MPKIADTTNAIARLSRAIPIYGDMIRPAAKELGKGLEKVAKTINLALEPLAGMIWGYGQVKTYLIHALASRLQHVNPRKIVTPPPEIAIPAIDALRWCGHRTEIRELFANLLARSMRAEHQDWCHPAFVGILKELTPDEARILKTVYAGARCFMKGGTQCVPIMQITVEVRGTKGCTCTQRHETPLQDRLDLQNPHVFPEYIDNLCRVLLLEIKDKPCTPYDYEGFAAKSKCPECVNALSAKKRRQAITVKKQVLCATDYGSSFMAAVTDPGIENAANKPSEGTR